MYRTSTKTLLLGLFFTLFLAVMPSQKIQAAGGSEDSTFNVTDWAMHHIADANEWHIVGDVTIPLPCIMYKPGSGLKTFMSNKAKRLKTDEEGNIIEPLPVGGSYYDHGRVVLTDASGNAMVRGNIIEFFTGKKTREHKVGDGEKATTVVENIYYDFSITKNVMTLLLTCLIMLFVFIRIARAYRKRGLKAPKGMQSFFEPIILFVRDTIAVPNMGNKRADKYMPFLLTVFFFIWIANLLGQIPLIANPNLTGNIAVTAALAIITFFLTSLAGNKHYWGHIFNPPGPAWIKPIMIPIEIIGIFTKPFALAIRLFANITAGHIIILSLTSLVFIFGKLGASVGGGAVGVGMALPFVLFMSVIELLVAFLQAFIFTMLSALFIGLAGQEHH